MYLLSFCEFSFFFSHLFLLVGGYLLYNIIDFVNFLGLILESFFVSFSFALFPCDLMTIFRVMFGFLSLFLCMDLFLDFCFVVTMKFIYSNLSTYVIIFKLEYL